MLLRINCDIFPQNFQHCFSLGIFFFLHLRTGRQCHFSPVQVVDYVWVLIFPHHENLIDDQFLLGLLLQVHLFNSNLKKTGTVKPCKHTHICIQNG